MSRSPRALLVFPIVIVLALSTACGDGDGDAPPPTTTPSPIDTPRAIPPIDSDAVDGVALDELGEEPVFWRTVDGFESLTAGIAYKIVLRVTNGYDGDTLDIEAAQDGELRVFTADRVEPGAGEAEGSYYTTNIELPPGVWQLTAVAGEDEVTLEVEAAG